MFNIRNPGRKSLTVALALFSYLIAMTVAVPSALAQSAIRDSEIEELLEDYSHPIFDAAGLHADSIDIYIINDPTLNAFVAGGQNMFINTGLILAADTPNELIGVIAHETGHIAGGHLARTQDAVDGIAVPAYVGAALGLALMVAGAPEAGLAVMMGGQHVAQREFLAYSRVQEASADQAGLSYLEATGQSGEGMVEFFDRFRDQEAMLGVNQDPYIRSHPLNQERIALLHQRMAELDYEPVPDTEESQHRLEMVQAKIRGFLLNYRVVMNTYPETDTSQPARYARAVAHFRRGETDLALTNIDSLLEEEPDNPYFHELRGQILFEGGRIAASIPEHRRSVELAPFMPLLRVNLAQALLASEEDRGNTTRNQEALRQLQFATIHDDTSAFAWYQLSVAYSRAGEDGLRDLSMAELYYSVSNREDARQFAGRARLKLDEGSVNWMRATDILLWADPHALDYEGRRSGRGLQ